jgi:two-component system, OmpR family, response regulator
MSSDDEVRVIVVDDYPDTAESLARALSLDGYTVWTAHDGASALALVAERKPHCVLFDVDMPGMDGFELAKVLRKNHEDIVLVAVTGWSENDYRVKGSFVVADYYLKKPIDWDELRRALPPVV